MFYKYNDGWIEVVTGPMFSGKTAEIIKRAETLFYAKEKFLVFKPSIDNRWSKNKIVSRLFKESKVVDAIVIDREKSSDILNILEKKDNDIKAIIIDEVQFFDESIIKTIQSIANKGKRVIVAGLDMDFQMKPFGSVPQILAISEFVTKLSAVCFKCHNSAAFSKRIKGSLKKTIEIGSETYEARCRKCFNV